MRSPDDTSELKALLEAGSLRAERIVALLGKTEGNGGVNDFTRRLATRATADLLAGYLRAPASDVQRRIPMVWSGGSDGVISPHMVIISRDAGVGGDGVRPRLAV